MGRTAQGVGLSNPRAASQEESSMCPLWVEATG